MCARGVTRKLVRFIDKGGSPLPANKVKIQVFMNSGKIINVTGDKVGADSPRRQRDQHVKMKLSGFVNVVPFRCNNSIDDSPRLDPLPFVRGDEPEVLRQIVDKPPHWPRSRAARQFGQHDGAASNDELQIQDLLFKAPGSQVIDVDRGVE